MRIDLCVTMDIEEIKLLSDYYAQQAQGGQGYNFYNGELYQNGYGIGSFLGGMFRGLNMLLKGGSKMLGRHLLGAATNVLNDISENPGTLRSSLKRRGLDTLDSLSSEVLSKMRGVGYTKRKRRNVKKSNKSSGSNKTKKRVTKKKRVKSVTSKPRKGKVVKKKRGTKKDYFG